MPMTCYDGYFLYPNLHSLTYDSVAELGTCADGKGAVASWSSTGLGVVTGHDNLNKGFFTAAFTNKVNTIGYATMAGK